jgi:hypothetical protein
MATEFERRPTEPGVERNYIAGGGGTAGVVALIVAIAIGAFVFFTFYNRDISPTSVSTTPRVTAPDRTPTTATPPASTTTPAPSTK